MTNDVIMASLNLFKVLYALEKIKGITRNESRDSLTKGSELKSLKMPVIPSSKKTNMPINNSGFNKFFFAFSSSAQAKMEILNKAKISAIILTIGGNGRTKTAGKIKTKKYFGLNSSIHLKNK